MTAFELRKEGVNPDQILKSEHMMHQLLIRKLGLHVNSTLVPGNNFAVEVVPLESPAISPSQSSEMQPQGPKQTELRRKAFRS